MSISKRYSYLVTVLCISALVLVMISLKNPPVEQPVPPQIDSVLEIEPPDFQVTKSLPIPESMSFAGEAVPLDIWDVRERLERELLVNGYWQSSTLLMIKRTKRFFPEIEKALKEAGVPDDFKYMAVAESGLLPAVSPSGARGIWQFLDATGESYGLEINSEIDERYDLTKATIAAGKYLKKSRESLGSWTLATASFNRGLSGTRGDLSRQKVKSYYDLHMNSETSRYVFRILALKLIIENPERYNFHLDKEDFYYPVPVYEATIDTTITDLADFALRHGTNYHILKELNPWLRDDHLTMKKGNSKVLRLPEIQARGVDEKK